MQISFNFGIRTFLQQLLCPQQDAKREGLERVTDADDPRSARLDSRDFDAAPETPGGGSGPI